MILQSIATDSSDVVIAGAGIVGLAIALELYRRGARVTVIETGAPMRQASIAAAGMLAVHDPHNPPALLPFSQLSADRYPSFLSLLENLSGIAVPIQTHNTLQYLRNGGVQSLEEQSLDPRQLAAALLGATQATSIQVLQQAEIALIYETDDQLQIHTSTGKALETRHLVHASGAWFQALPVVSPRKGQMLRVELPLDVVHRSESVYIVPRTVGPYAGTSLIGATVEDAGFDTSTHAEDLASLRRLASELVPQAESAREVEAWAGLRPSTPDELPLIGHLHGHHNQLVATGHFRNGILLAPATANIIADLIENKSPAINLDPYAPSRFTSCAAAPHK